MIDTTAPIGPGAPARPQDDDNPPPHPAHRAFVNIIRAHGCDLSEVQLGRFFTCAAADGTLYGIHWRPIERAPTDRHVDLWAITVSDLDGSVLDPAGARFPDCRRDPDDSPTGWHGLPPGWRATHYMDRPTGPEGLADFPGALAVESKFGPNTRARAMILAHVLKDNGLPLEMRRAVTLLAAFLAGERGEALGMPPLAADPSPEAIAAAWEAAGVLDFLPQAEAARAALWPEDGGGVA